MSDTPHQATDLATEQLPPPRPNENTYLKFRNEILAGGASEQEDLVQTVGGMRAVTGIGIIVLLLGALAWWSWWSFVFVVLLLGCIFLHELGHFVTARWTGMKATQFFLFMGPKLWSFKRGETEYGVRAYPVGAFVRIIGMNNLDEVDPADEPRAYRNQTYPRRMLVICAGSLMHMLIAVSLLFGVYSIKGDLRPSGQVSIRQVLAGAPASQAGLLADDVVLSVDGRAVSTAAEFVHEIQSHSPGDTATLLIERDGVQQSLQIPLGSNPNPGQAFGKGYIGTTSAELNTWQSMSVVSAATHSITGLGDGLWASVTGVVTVLNPVNIFTHVSGSNTDQATQPTTVVGVSRFSDVVGGETGIGGVLVMLAGVNVFVGLLNLFPILPFDGGHAAIATYERLRSRKGRPAYRADISKMVPVALAMMGLLGFLMLAGLYLDITKPIG